MSVTALELDPTPEEREAWREVLKNINEQERPGTQDEKDVRIMDLELELSATQHRADLWKAKAKSWRRTAQELEKRLDPKG
jgi:uncharacterized membrane protein